jgi:mRNA interferase MazF
MNEIVIKHGFMYLADLSPSSGTEAGKLRPVVVIQTNFLNEAYHPSTWVLPCTTQLTSENLLRVRLPKNIAGNNEECDVMIDQSRAIDNQRFRKELFSVPSLLLREIKDKLRLAGDL